MSGLPAFEVSRLFMVWQLRPGMFAVLVLAAAGYLAATGRVRRSGGRWPARRLAALLAGLAVVGFATGSGVESHGRVLAWVHMVEHLLLIMVAPPLLAGSPLLLVGLALPPGPATAWRRLAGSAPVTAVTSPPAAVALYTAAVAGVHLTGLMDTTMRSHPAHITEKRRTWPAGCCYASRYSGRHRCAVS